MQNARQGLCVGGVHTAMTPMATMVTAWPQHGALQMERCLYLLAVLHVVCAVLVLRAHSNDTCSHHVARPLAAMPFTGKDTLGTSPGCLQVGRRSPAARALAVAAFDTLLALLDIFCSRPASLFHHRSIGLLGVCFQSAGELLWVANRPAEALAHFALSMLPVRVHAHSPQDLTKRLAANVCNKGTPSPPACMLLPQHGIMPCSRRTFPGHLS